MERLYYMLVEGQTSCSDPYVLVTPRSVAVFTLHILDMVIRRESHRCVLGAQNVQLCDAHKEMRVYAEPCFLPSL